MSKRCPYALNSEALAIHFYEEIPSFLLCNPLVSEDTFLSQYMLGILHSISLL